MDHIANQIFDYSSIMSWTANSPAFFLFRKTQNIFENLESQWQQWDYEHPIDSGRQLQQINSIATFLGGFLPNITLDSPTVMSLLILIAFVVQFYWTVVSVTLASSSSSSSSSSSDNSATTVATRVQNAIASGNIPNPDVTTSSPTTVNIIPRTQTVTPAPAPAYRFYMQNNVPFHHLVGKRSADMKNINHSRNDMDLTNDPYYEYLKNFNNNIPTKSPIEHIRRYSGHKTSSPTLKNRFKFPLDYGSVKFPFGNKEKILFGKLDRKKFNLISPDKRNSRVAWSGEMPLALASHRLSDLQQDDEVTLSGLLYTAEKWGQRLRDWNIIPKDGAKTMAETLLVVRCAIAKDPAVCGQLDHYYRRQHDLKIAAAIMNHQDSVSNHIGDDLNYKNIYGEMDKDQPHHAKLTNEKNNPFQGPSVFKKHNGSVFYSHKPVFGSRIVDSQKKIESAENRRGVGYAVSHDDHVNQYDLKYKQKSPEHLRHNIASNKIGVQKPFIESKLDHETGFLTFSSFTIGPPYNLYLFLTMAVVLVFLLDASYRLLSLVFAAARSEDPQFEHQSLTQFITNALSKWDIPDFIEKKQDGGIHSRTTRWKKRKRRQYIKRKR